MQAYGNPKPRHEWCFDWSSQLGLVVNQIYWCQEVEAAFDAMAAGDAGAMKKYSEMQVCLVYTSDAADDLRCVALGGRRTINTSN